MKLLICDDDISTIDVICAQCDFPSLGIDTVLRAYNGEAAIDLIGKSRPELILCDIGMPRVNGIQVLKYIHENNIPTEFTFLTCYAEFEYARDAVRYGASNYLTKPIDFEELREVLKKMTASAAVRRPYLAEELPAETPPDPTDDAPGYISPDEVRILRCVRDRDADTFLAYITGEANRNSRGRNSRSMMARLHQDLLRIFSRCLWDNNIPLQTLFQSEALRRLDENAVRSAGDFTAFAAGLFDRAVEELQRVMDKTDIIGIVKAYIGEHFRENIDRDDLAAVAFITPNYLSKRFHAELGMSLREYINQLRVDEAKKLLLSTNASISEVASQVGYNNISYFSTVFRRLCGMSPVEWCGGRKGDADK